MRDMFVDLVPSLNSESDSTTFKRMGHPCIDPDCAARPWTHRGVSRDTPWNTVGGGCRSA